MRKYVLVSGLGWSGSSAVTDWLADIQGVEGGLFVVPREFKILARANIYSILSAKRRRGKILHSINGIKTLIRNRLKWRDISKAPRSISNKTERLHLLDLKTVLWLLVYILFVRFASERLHVWYWRKYLDYVVGHFCQAGIIVLDQPSVLGRDDGSMKIFGNYLSVVVHRDLKDQCFDDLSRKNKLSEDCCVRCLSRKRDKLKKIAEMARTERTIFIGFERFVENQNDLMGALKNKFFDEFRRSYHVSRRFDPRRSKMNIGIGEGLNDYLCDKGLMILEDAERIRGKLGQVQ